MVRPMVPPGLAVWVRKGSTLLSQLGVRGRFDLGEGMSGISQGLRVSRVLNP